MTCERAAEWIDAIAEGEPPPADVAAHLSACAACAESLRAARIVDDLLRTRPAPAAPAKFTSRVMSQIRRTSWRREQIVYAIFNAAMIAAALAVAAGLLIALRRTGVSFDGRDAMQMFSAGMLTAAQKVAPSLPVYAGAIGLIAVALGVWWWASDSAAL